MVEMRRIHKPYLWSFRFRLSSSAAAADFFSRIRGGRAGPSFALQRKASSVLHRPEDGIALGIDAAEQGDSPFCAGEQIVGFSQQSNPLFVVREGLI
jgi:hypothetical protein